MDYLEYVGGAQNPFDFSVDGIEILLLVVAIHLHFPFFLLKVLLKSLQLVLDSFPELQQLSLVHPLQMQI